MEEGHASADRWVGYVDWRNKPTSKCKHGGMAAASFVLVVEVLENLAFLANASNLVIYLSQFMHMSPSKSANTVTTFMGTSFLLALFGGFLSDAYLTTYLVYLASSSVEFVGLVILMIQARTPALKPPESCGGPCGEEVSGAKAVMLFVGLYTVAFGVGGIKGSLPAHGAEQFDQGTTEGRRGRSTFFNYFVFCLSAGGLIAVTFVVWIEDNKGWQWGFLVSTMAMVLSMVVFLAGSATYRNKIPKGSPLTTIAKVIAAAAISKLTVDRKMKRKSPTNSIIPDASAMTAGATFDGCRGHGKDTEKQEEEEETTLSRRLSFLNRAATWRRWPTCNTVEVEEVKVVIGIFPIFLLTIVLNCCLAQLSTFSIEQAATMDTAIGNLTVPPASLPVFPIVVAMLLTPLYDHMILPFFRRITKTEMGVSHLQRIGVGLILSIVAMAVAALVETKRKRVAFESGMLDSKATLPVTFLWISLQYLFLGSADLFTLAGLLEFFFTEAPTSMRSLATSLSWASLAMGYYLSSVLVSVINMVTKGSGHHPWLEGKNLNWYRLERFYWLMCVLSLINYVVYLFWAMQYQYRSVAPDPRISDDGDKVKEGKVRLCLA